MVFGSLHRNKKIDTYSDFEYKKTENKYKNEDFSVWKNPRFFCRFMLSVALHMSGKAVLFPTAFTKTLSAKKSYETNLSVYLQTVQ